MRVLFDHQAFALQRWGGVSRYFLELLSGLAPRVEVELALARSMNEHVPALERLLGMRVSDEGFATIGRFLGQARRGNPLVAVLEGGYRPEALERSVRALITGVGGTASS